jgi:hypothetical protein
MNAKPILVVGLSKKAAFDGRMMQQTLDQKLTDYHVLLYFSNNITDLKFQVLNALDADEKTIEEIRQMIKEAMI